MFDGYQEELSTKDGAHERRTGGRADPTVDFTRNMVMKSKKEDLLSNKDNKQRFIRMLGQSLEHVGCEIRHAKGGADVLLRETTVQSAMSGETTSVGDDTDLLVLLCFHVKEDSCEVRNKEEPTMLEHQVCAKSAGTCSLQQSVVCSCHPRLWYNFSGIQHRNRTRS